MAKRVGKQTLFPDRPAIILSHAAIVGKKEGEGPLGKGFDYVSEDGYFGENSWEKAEQQMLRRAFSLCCDKAGMAPSELDFLLGGDLLNQCTSSSLSMKECGVPYWGLYGACSTMAEGLCLASLLVDGGSADTACVLTGSHFCTAERQYRFPLEYGGTRPRSSQWTVTGAGAVLLGSFGDGIRLTALTPGKIVDAGVKDPNHMGAAMAPAACDTLVTHLRDTGRELADYDAVFTGDLGALGHDILRDLLAAEGVDTDARYSDCGVLIYDLRTQGVNSGGSGCGCCASVLAGHILPAMERGVWKRVLFAATGALMSPTSAQQGESIPGICHALVLERTGEGT